MDEPSPVDAVGIVRVLDVGRASADVTGAADVFGASSSAGVRESVAPS